MCNTIVIYSGTGRDEEILLTRRVIRQITSKENDFYSDGTQPTADERRQFASAHTYTITVNHGEYVKFGREVTVADVIDLTLNVWQDSSNDWTQKKTIFTCSVNEGHRQVSDIAWIADIVKNDEKHVILFRRTILICDHRGQAVNFGIPLPGMMFAIQVRHSAPALCANENCRIAHSSMSIY